MDGIQLLGTPSMNLNWLVSPSFAQNIGTSGIEIRKPAKAKMFAIQRMASLLSFGTKRRISAPTSGVKRMMDRMWVCIRTVLSSRFPVLSDYYELPAARAEESGFRLSRTRLRRKY